MLRARYGTEGMKSFLETTLLGLPIMVWSGIDIFALILLEVLLGLRIIKTNPKYHKALAYLILLVVLIHGIMGTFYFLGK